MAISLEIGAGCSIPYTFIDAPAVTEGHPVSADGPTAVVTNETGRPSCTLMGRDPVNADIDIVMGRGEVTFTGRIPLELGQAVECAIGVTPEANVLPGLNPFEELCRCTLLALDGSAALSQIVCDDFGIEETGEHCPLVNGYVYADGCAPP